MITKTFIDKVRDLLARVTMSCLDKKFYLVIEYDRKYENKDFMFMYPRVYIQIKYTSLCIKTDKIEDWKGRKWYLSEHMTNDEIIKTTYCAFEAAVKHEVMEGFKIDGNVLFNPHVNFEELLLISNKEIKRL